MKASRDGNTVVVVLTVAEAAKLQSFVEFASRKSMNWAFQGNFGKRWLHYEHDEAPGVKTCGLKETRKLAKLLGDRGLISEDEANEVFEGL